MRLDRLKKVSDRLLWILTQIPWREMSDLRLIVISHKEIEKMREFFSATEKRLLIKKTISELRR